VKSEGHSQTLATASIDTGAIDHLVLAGWAGRDQAAVEAHIRELEALGTSRPSRTPVFYRVASSLLTTSDAIQVVASETSGEVEFVLVVRDDGVWVGLAVWRNTASRSQSSFVRRWSRQHSGGSTR
jgi:hypothetical protein